MTFLGGSSGSFSATSRQTVWKPPHGQEIHENKCAHELNMTFISEWQKWVCRALGSWGFCTLTPASIQIKHWQKAVGVGSRAPLIKQWSWLLQEAAISHWSLGTVWKSHKGLCLSMSITVCTQSYSGVGCANLCSFLIPPWFKIQCSVVSVTFNIRQPQTIYWVH